MQQKANKRRDIHQKYNQHSSLTSSCSMQAPTPSPTYTHTLHIHTHTYTHTHTHTHTHTLVLATPTPSSRVQLSPPLIAMLVVAAAAFLLVTYSHFISRRLLPPFRRALLRYRRPLFPLSVMDSPPPHLFESSDGFFLYSPYGLDDSVINDIPLSVFQPCKLFEVDCAVCLLDFEDGDYMRTLPHCFHSFHVDCIDAWLRSHATCPLCRSGVLFPARPMPMTPLMASRIRPSLEEGILLEDIMSPQRRRAASEDHQGLLMKRSYSFTTPGRSSSSMWMKRSAGIQIAKSWRKSVGGRRSMGAMSEWTGRMRYMGKRGVYSTSRTRTGDPEALISPERVRRHVEGGTTMRWEGH